MLKNAIKRSVFLAALALSATANAGVVTFNLTTGINGTTPLSTDLAPWLTATFTDVTLANGTQAVQLVMTNNLVNATTHVASGEYVTDWLFNVNPAISGFTQTYVSGFKAGVSIGAVDGGSAIKAGTFDIDFTGGTAGSNRFSGGMTSVYDFAGTGLTANSFLFTSDNGGYYSAADVKGIPTGLSGSIGTKTAGNGGGAASAATAANVPEPASVTLLGLGMAALFGAQRRKKNSNKV